ncbi:MAG: hypothetical protein QXV17_06945 [Candidatus Micrarchaeaceae archaeon]
MVINWGDNSTSTITTASTKYDTGSFTIFSYTAEYMQMQGNYIQIPIKGTVKYLILGKTL